MSATQHRGTQIPFTVSCMPNATGNELDELHHRALRDPAALTAFRDYLEAKNTRDDLILRKLDATGAEREIETKCENLERLLAMPGEIGEPARQAQ